MRPKITQALLLFVIVTGMSGMVYLTVQQDFRQNANDPQIQIAEDAAQLLNSGAAPTELINGNDVFDIAQSLATFVTIYGTDSKAIVSNAKLDNATPDLPSGVADYVKQRGEYRFTWQPKKGVRNAVVVTPFHNDKASGYVLVGRSLREVEQRENQLGLEVLIGWFVTLALSLALVFFPIHKKDIVLKQNR